MSEIEERAERHKIHVLMQRTRSKEEDKKFLRTADSRLKELYCWVLEQMENPTTANTEDHIVLERMSNCTVRIGRKLETNKVMGPNDMWLLFRMFNGTEGFWVKYTPDNSINPNSVFNYILEIGIE